MAAEERNRCATRGETAPHDPPTWRAKGTVGGSAPQRIRNALRATEDPERKKRSDDIDSTAAAGPRDAAHVIDDVTRSDRDIKFDRLLAEPGASRYQPAKEAGANKKQIRASHPANRIRNSHLFGG